MRKLIIVPVVVVLIALAGCSSSSNNNQPKTLRTVDLAGKYEMYQLEFNLSAGGKMPIVLQLNSGDKVDGYYYLESGDKNVAFQITSGATTVYSSDLKNLSPGMTISDRFSFTASGLQDYTLTLSNASDATSKAKSTLYLEVIYPGTSKPFVELQK